MSISRDGSKINVVIDADKLTAFLESIGITVISYEDLQKQVDLAFAADDDVIQAAGGTSAPRPDLTACIMASDRVMDCTGPFPVDVVIPESNQIGYIDITDELSVEPCFIASLRAMAIIYNAVEKEYGVRIYIKSPQLDPVHNFAIVPRYSCEITGIAGMGDNLYGIKFCKT